MLHTKEKEITRTKASFLGGTRLERGRHSGSSPTSHLVRLEPTELCTWHTSYRIRGGIWLTPYTSCNYS
jgi:hypothetical protein